MVQGTVLMKKAIVFSASSDIGYALCLRLIKEKYNIFGTFRHDSEKVRCLKSAGAILYQCNLLDKGQLSSVLTRLQEAASSWNALIMLQATMNPIGRLVDVDMDEWATSIQLNFVDQVRILQRLMGTRETGEVPSVITFAGGGTNNATSHFSAYTISKIALIKMAELLYEEFNDTKFTCIGPGWVKTKIHNETLKAREKAGIAYDKTIRHMERNQFTDLNKVIDCIVWVLNATKEQVSGRNFSVAYDRWGDRALEEKLEIDPDMYKLRRKGNVWNG